MAGKTWSRQSGALEVGNFEPLMRNNIDRPIIGVTSVALIEQAVSAIVIDTDRLLLQGGHDSTGNRPIQLPRNSAPASATNGLNSKALLIGETQRDFAEQFRCAQRPKL